MHFNRIVTALSCLLISCNPSAFGDYTCVCNYNAQKSVFSTTDETGSPLGYVYEFDCKQKLDSQQYKQGWFKIAFEDQVAFMQQDDRIEIQLCPGDPPSVDIGLSTIPTTTAQTKQTVSPSIDIVFSLGNANLCSDTVRTFAQSHHGTLAQFDKNCYVLVKDIQHWHQAELSCGQAGGHLVHISSQMEQSYIHSFLKSNYDHSIWIGLSDTERESHFKWSSGQQFYFVNWANHTHFSDTFEDCVVMDMHFDGKWDDRECSFEFYPYMCQYGLARTDVDITTQPSNQNVSSASNFSDGNKQLCPRQVQSDATFHGAILGQYEGGCYELLLNTKVSWEHGENICQAKGGHLAHISNSQQQAFVESFMTRHNPNRAVWLGLHDTIKEGAFQWTAGTAVQYTNWIHGHTDNTLDGHNYEDCVTFVPQRQGYWDDVHCGYEEIFGSDSGETHYAFCQYKIQNAVPVVG